MKTLRLDGRTLRAVAGHHEEALRLIESTFDVRLTARGDDVTIAADGADGEQREQRVARLLSQIAQLGTQGIALGRDEMKTAVRLLAADPEAKLESHFIDARLRPSSKRTIVPKSENQRRYIHHIRDHDLVFGVGPAGTGKTYLAVAMAIAMLNENRVRRILLVRPAVEAGERLGFLPGDIAAKVDPYLRPLYDALFDMLEPHRAEELIERGIVEVAPLAFMRGRTLNDSFVILDEAQNTTSEQMKMFLTRFGFNSKAVITGDVTQIDLPHGKVSGLIEAQQVVRDIRGISVVLFDERDVVRHPLVQRIILAYERLGTPRERDAGRPSSSAEATRRKT